MSKAKDPEPARQYELAEVIALVKEIVQYWRELGRRRFDSNPPEDGSSFEDHWPRLLENFFLVETIRAEKRLRVLSANRDN